MTVWRKREDVAVVDSGDHVVVLNLTENANGVPHAIEGSGRHIWRLIDGVCSDAELIEKLSETFGVGTEAIATDVHEFLARLAEDGLITATQPTPGDAQ